MLNNADTEVPIKREMTIIIKDDFSCTKLIVVKKNRHKSITGSDCRIASCLEREKNVESIKITANKRTGILRGFIRTVTFLSARVLTPHNMRRTREAKTIRICFGKVKKSVVIVRKKTGNSRYTVAVNTVAIVVIKPIVDLLFIYLF